VPASDEIMRVSKENRTVKYRAYAKVNLALAVGKPRADGYHDVYTVMVPVRLCDYVTVGAGPWDSGQEPRPGSSSSSTDGTSRIHLSCPALPELPEHKNLAYIAAAAFLTKTGVRSDVHITVDKRIPWGSGMGGGSSDAAAVLLALNGLLPPERALDIDDLVSLATSIGADVPFFVGCNAVPPLWKGAQCEGIGEKVTPVDVPDMWLVLAFPEVPVDTGKAYARLDDLRSSKGLEATEDSSFGDRTEGLDAALAAGDVEEIGRRLFNDLEEAAVSFCPEIGRLKRMFYECGALGAAMTGSGSAVFGIAGSEREALDLASILDRMIRSVSEIRVREIIVARTGVDRNGC
jgi:4-diphosphocytidyl-2-C-methyl-D-erythritol kinase